MKRCGLNGASTALKLKQGSADKGNDGEIRVEVKQKGVTRYVELKGIHMDNATVFSVKVKVGGTVPMKDLLLMCIFIAVPAS